MSIRIFYDDISFRLKGSVKIKRFIGKVISENGKISGDLSFIFTDDDSLRKINIEFLEHDYFTDVITFSYNQGNVINGEIYISIDTVRENSLNYKDSLQGEVLRVMVHGVLHLLGYDDKTDAQRKKMSRLEDKWLKFAESMHYE